MTELDPRPAGTLQAALFMRLLEAAANLGIETDAVLHRCELSRDQLADLCRYPVDDSGLGFQYPSLPQQDPSPHVCLDEGIVPHTFEGFFITFGDIALKAGWGADEARALYRSAQTAPNYATWPFADTLEARIAAAEDNALRFADDDLLNDPVIWLSDGHICTGCHQDP